MADVVVAKGDEIEAGLGVVGDGVTAEIAVGQAGVEAVVAVVADGVVVELEMVGLTGGCMIDPDAVVLVVGDLVVLE